MSGKRTAHHLHLNRRGEELWDESPGYRKRVKIGAQFVADDAGVPIVIRTSGEAGGQDRILIILYPKPPRWIHR